MKKKFVIAAFLATFLGGCHTVTKVTYLSPNRYLVCDDASADNLACDGANPEKGINKVCLPWGRSIAKIETAPRTFEQGVIVTCSPR